MAISIGEIEATLRLRNEMTPQLREAISTVKQAGAQIEAGLRSASTAFSGLSSSGRRSLGQISADLTEAEARVKKYKDAIKAHPGNQTVFDAAERGLQNLLPRVQALKKEMAEARRELDGGTKATEGLHLSMQQLGASLTSVGRVWSTYITAPIVAAGAASVGFASQYEASTTKIHTLSGITKADMESMRKKMLELAPAVGVGPDKLADAMLAVTSTGIKGAEAMDVLTSAAKATAVGMGDTTTVARTLVAVMHAYGESGLTADRAMEVMFKTVKDGNADAATLAGTLGRVVGIASQMGVSFEEVGAFVATFTRLGVGADEAVTALRSTLAEMLKPSQQAEEALAEVGLSMAEVRREVNEKGFMATLEDLTARFKGNEDGLTRVFSNVRALAGIMGTAGSQTEAYAQIQAHLTEQTHEFSDAMEETKKTLNFKWDSFVADLKAMAIVLGNDLLPQVKAFIDRLRAPGGAIDSVKDWIKWWRELPDGVKTFAEVIIGLFAVGGPVLIALGAVARAIGAIQVLLFGANVAADMSIVAWLSKLAGMPGVLAALGGTAIAGGAAVGTAAALGVVNAGMQGRGSELAADIGRVLGGRGGRDINLPNLNNQPSAFTNMEPVRVIPVGPSAPGFVAGGTVTGLGAAAPRRIPTKEELERAAKAWERVVNRINTVHASFMDPTPNFANLPGRLRPMMPSYFEAARKAELGMYDPTPNFENLPGRLPALNPDAYNGFSFTGPELPIPERMSTQDLYGRLANSFVQMSQLGKAGPIMQNMGQAFVNLSNWDQMRGMFGEGSSRSSKLAGVAMAGTAIAQGAMDVWNATGSSRSAAGNAFNGSQAGAAAGAAFGPWGMAIGAAAGLVVGIVRGKPEWAKAADDVGRDFGVRISDDLGKAIAQHAKAMFGGNRQAASIFNLDRIIGEAGGVTTNNVGAFADKLRDVFSMLETGRFTLAQAGEVLDKNFTQMVEASTDSLGFLSGRMREIIALDRRFGTNSQAVSQYLREQAQVAAESANTLVRYAAGVATSASELESLGVIAMATFAAAMEAGKSFAESLAMAGPGLQALAEAFTRVGVNTDNAALRVLMLQSTILQRNPELLQAIGSLGSSLVALSNMGMLNAETFRAMEATGMAMYTRLQAAVSAQGGTTRDALLPMQDYLQRAAAAARELGLPLDQNTQMLIDQSKELGIWQEAGKSANDRIIDGLTRIGDALENVLRALGLLPGAAAAAAAGVPPNPFGSWRVPGVEMPELEPRAPEYHTGGFVWPSFVAHTGLAPDEVLGILQTGEGVLNRRATAAVGGSDGIRALNSGDAILGMPDTGGGTIVSPRINIVLNNPTFDTPYGRQQAMDQISRAVLDAMRREGRLV